MKPTSRAPSGITKSPQINTISKTFQPIIESSNTYSYTYNYCTNRLDVYNNNPNTWIIDLGATDHITNSLELFASCRPIKGMYTRLPNSQIAKVTHIGEVHISLDFIL